MKLLSKIISLVNLKKALIATIIFLILLWIIDFSPIGVAGLVKLTGGPSILDFEHGYSVDKAYSMLNALGEDGRNFYLTKILPVDIFFPMGFMLFNFSWISLLLAKISKEDSKLRYIAFLPLLNMLCDWSENIGFFLMLKNFPNQLIKACKIASIFTHIKFTCVLIIIIAIATLLVCFVIKTLCSAMKEK